MKTLIAVLCVVGFAALGTAQTSAPSSTLLVQAQTVDGGTLSGGVEAQLPGAIMLQAQELEFRNGGRDLALSGDVIIRLSSVDQVRIRDASGRELVQRIR